jgi:hypothetical protein
VPLTVMTFLGGGRTPASADELSAVKARLDELAPPGSRTDVRALDDHYMTLDIPSPPARPRVRESADLDDDLEARIAGTIWLSDELDDLELVAANTCTQVDDVLGARTTAVFDSRVHLDLVGDGEQPAAYVLVPIARAAARTRDEFIWYYRTHHVPLAKSVGPRFTRYTTHRVLHTRGDFGRDGITVQEFPSLAEIDAHVKTRIEPSDVTINDLENFMSRVDYYVGDRAVF